ncbi:actin cytoskeleton-regulatory complex protein PAN1 [Drosophila madeirensis]|uniref:Actin cytoskeleton-regulatory complex protein PAN1 n=1 Tax=Drosophila madeirensis TaxID=30013 RepID=A0AAU9FZS3_DROMD
MSHQQFHHYHHQHQHQHQQLQQVQSESQLERTLESERNQQNQRSANSNTERVSGLGSMDFRNLCQRLDVNGLRAKLPSLPSLPPLKMPKSLPKLRGRKIFRSSRRNNNSKDAAVAAGAAGAAATAQGVDAGGRCSLTLPQQSQQFINRTPQRISTISSLMYEEEQEMGMGMGMARGQPSTYRSAGSLDDDYYAPESGHGERHSRPISPVKIPSPPAPASGGQGQPTLTQRLQRGYKSLSELRLKHLFAKQTTLRRDNIEVDRYVEQYEAELRAEQRAQARRDREIADNYDIRFKTLARSRQNTPDSDKQPPKPRSVAEQSGDESGMEETPPPLPTRSRKKPGIAATRFAKVRQPPLQMDEEEETERQKHVEEKEAPPRRSSCKQLLQKLPSFPNSLPSLQRRSKGSEERAQRGEETPTQKSAIRQNIKRLRKSIKRPAKLKQKQPQKPADDSDEDQGQGQGQLQEQQQEEKKEPPVAKSTGNLRARLSRFASTEQLQERWRKSFKTAAQDSQESPKQAGAGAGAAAGAATGMAIGVHLERTLTKLNEKMHQLKFFQRQGAAAASTSSCSAEAQPKPNTVGHEPVYIDDDEELAATYHHSDSDEDEEERGSQDSGQDVCAEEAFGQQEEEEEADSEEETQMEHPLSGASSAHAARQMATLAELQAATASAALAEESCPRGGRSFTAWSSESLEEIPDEDYPRVLIHQQHTDDSCESTLIIAVSTKPSSPAPPTPGQWLPNAEIISSFKEQQQQQQQQQQQPKEAESWPGPRSLYKPKSIDIFEGASGAAFADFDEALRNAPILRISAGSSCDTSGDEEADDSSSRVTRIRMQTDPPPQIGNSRESLMAQELEEEEEDDQDEEEEDSAKEDSDECALERPPSASPPPPPLPQRRPLQRKISPPTQAAPIYDAVPPPLPTSKPPPLSMTPAAAAAAATPPPAAAVLPQRSSASMSRPAKPLVKTSSLRLTYNEQVHPGDIGKVNKLISRFEGGRRPRLCPRRLHSEEYELHATSSSFSGEEEQEEEEQDDDDAEEDEAASPITPTNRPVVVIPEIVTTQPSINNNNNGRRKAESLSLSLDQSLDRQNSNCSRSEYGSPLSYPYASQRRSSTPTGAPLAPPSSSQLSTPHQQMLQQQQQQRQQARRSRRSMTRDDENFYSFDSDEENSYYSISPSGSSRYVVEI